MLNSKHTTQAWSLQTQKRFLDRQKNIKGGLLQGGLELFAFWEDLWTPSGPLQHPAAAPPGPAGPPWSLPENPGEP